MCIGLALASCGPGPASTAAGGQPDQGVGSPRASDEEEATTDTSRPGAPYVLEDSQDPVEKRLAVILDGQTVYLRNGGQVILGDGLAVEIYLDPYPPSALQSTLDFYLTRAGSPVTDAGVGIDYDMLAMGHGPFSAEATNIGAGHYLVSLDYIMFGAWEQDITIRIGLQRIRFPLVVVAYP